MNSVRLKVPLPKPCSQNWDAMLTAENGRHCLNCQKTVVDFTKKSDEEIINYLSQHKRVCGRFYTEQVLQPHEYPKSGFRKFKEYFITATLVLGTKLAALTPAAAQTASVAKTVVNQPEKENMKPVFAPEGNLYLRGVVLDPANDKPLKGVLVAIVLQNIQTDFRNSGYYRNSESSYYDSSPYQTKTDASGKFELIIPAVELGSGNNQLSFQFPDYDKVNRPLNYSESLQQIVQYLKKTEPYTRERIENLGSYVVGLFPGGNVKYLVAPEFPYKTRTGKILSKVTYPYWWIRRLISGS